MTKKTILITGVSGEIGFKLAKHLSKDKNNIIIGIDLQHPKEEINTSINHFYKIDILNQEKINKIFIQHPIKEIYHLAALLSTNASKKPFLAHDINVNGTLNLLRSAQTHFQTYNKRIKIFFPSSIAVYGIKNKNQTIVNENECLHPYTIYGINKLYCENIGQYFSPTTIDFRSLRLPGIISTETIPTGGTSDFAPEMLHAIFSGKNYTCFVNKKSCLPFMSMDQAIKAIIKIMGCKENRLSQRIYNVKSFSISAQYIEEQIKQYFDQATIQYEPNQPRQAIVDSWPDNINDDLAKHDWGWNPNPDFNSSIIDGFLKKYK